MKNREKVNNVSKLTDDLKEREAKKNQNIKYTKLVESMGWEDIEMSDKTKDRISDCGTFLQFISDIDLESNKLVGANFCGNRFCPHCSYNKARKDAYEVYLLVEHLKSKGYKFIFLTLTAPNISGDLLEQEIRDYTSSFRRMFDRKEVKMVNRGCIRKLEVTYNSERDDYHPHYHVLIAVNSSYFTDTKVYLNQSRWLELWRESKRDPSITQVDIRRFKNDGSDKGILELTKYISKDSHYLHSDEVFKAFYNSLKGKRIFSFQGVFKDARKKLKDGELDHLKEVDETEYFYELWYKWSRDKYSKDRVFELSDEDKERYKNLYKKDMDID